MVRKNFNLSDVLAGELKQRAGISLSSETDLIKEALNIYFLVQDKAAEGYTRIKFRNEAEEETPEIMLAYPALRDYAGAKKKNQP